MAPRPTEGRTQDSKFLRTQQRLWNLVDQDPSAAIVAARKLPTDGHAWQRLRAVILCDAGRAIRDLRGVEEASEILSKLLDLSPEDGSLAYDLANSLVGRAELDSTSIPDWYFRTGVLRRRARALFGHSGRLLRGNDLHLASQAMTNLGSSLDTAHRWIEAFECYQEALALHPRNGVASGCAACILFRIASTAILEHQPHLIDVAQRLAHHAKSNSDFVAEFADPQAVAIFEKLPSKAAGLATTPGQKKASAYERFVVDHRLLLSPILEGIGHDRKRWDDAHIASLTESINSSAGVPPLFAMFNVMKADYLVARELLFWGLHERAMLRDSGLYFDTLDYAVYGTTPSQLVLAQRAALDLLDKVAVALNEYFATGQRPKGVTFHGFWRDKLNELTWKPFLAKAITEGNVALVALSEIASDLSDGSQEGSEPGLLNPEKRARHAGTHRFVVLHDINMGGSRPSAAIEHHDIVAFQDTVLRTVRLARAALLHFLEVIAYSERSPARSKKVVGQIDVCPHHVIRGKA